MPDVVVVGAGPNGLAAAVVMARAGLSVELFEASSTIGGGTRTSELMQPGHFHDVCSAVHPMAVASPFFKGLRAFPAGQPHHARPVLRLASGRWKGRPGLPVAGQDS
jgi:phytoene dehydrogenase-like protein